MKTVWLPILILGYVLRSPRLLLLALTPMLFEILVGFGFLYFVSLTGLNISYYALMIMLMLIMALSWDYALFMLTRYKAEREAGATVEQAIIEMVARSGSIVVVSGASVRSGVPSSLLRFVIFPHTNIAPRLGMVSSLSNRSEKGGIRSEVILLMGRNQAEL